MPAKVTKMLTESEEQHYLTNVQIVPVKATFREHSRRSRHSRLGFFKEESAGFT